MPTTHGCGERQKLGDSIVFRRVSVIVVSCRHLGYPSLMATEVSALLKTNRTSVTCASSPFSDFRLRKRVHPHHLRLQSFLHLCVYLTKKQSTSPSSLSCLFDFAIAFQRKAFHLRPSHNVKQSPLRLHIFAILKTTLRGCAAKQVQIKPSHSLRDRTSALDDGGCSDG